jgi:hypothetical protein
MVLRQRFAASFCLLASTVFVLSPLTTIRQFLNAAFTFNPAYILLFAGLLLYIRDRRWAAYASAAGALLTYESIFMLFVAAPLLLSPPVVSRKTAAHVGICLLLLAAFSAIRIAGHEPRALGVMGDSVGAHVLAAVAHPALYAVNIAALYARALYMAVREASLESVIYSVAFAALSGWYLFRPGLAAETAEDDPSMVRRAAGLGLAFLALGLSVSSFVLPGQPLDSFVAMGRSTRVFASAELGASILVAAAWCAVLRPRFRRLDERLARAACAMFLVGLLAYCLVVQRDYVEVWTRQQNLLAQAILLTPDIQPDSTIMLRRHYPDPGFWAVHNRRRAIGDEYAMFGEALSFLLEVDKKPKIFFVFSDEWKDYLSLKSDGTLRWTATTVPHRWDIRNPPLTAGRVIALDTGDGGRLVRPTMPLEVNGHRVGQPPPVLSSNWATLRGNRLFRQVVPDVIPLLPAQRGGEAR